MDATKTIRISDKGRIQVIDHGDLGVAILYEELAPGKLNTKRKVWNTMEEVLIPRAALAEVIQALTWMGRGEI